MRGHQQRSTRRVERWSAFELPVVVAAERRRELYFGTLDELEPRHQPDRLSRGDGSRRTGALQRGVLVARHMALAIWSLLAR